MDDTASLNANYLLSRKATAMSAITTTSVSTANPVSIPQAHGGDLRQLYASLRKRVKMQAAAIKKGFFAMLVALLVEGHNTAFTVLVAFVEFLQYLAFCFEDIEWGGRGNELGNLLQFFQVEQVVVQRTFPAMIYILTGISVALILTMICLAVYVVRSFVLSDFNAGVWPLRLLRTLVSFLSSVFFLPVTYSLFSIFECNPAFGYDCGTNVTHVVMRVLAGLALPLFLCFTLFMSMTYFNPNPRSKSIAARPTARLELVELSSKALLAAFFVFGKEVPVLRSSVTFITATYTSAFMLLFIPYYTPWINIYRFILTSEVLWGSVFSIIMALLSDSDSEHISETRDYIFYVYLATLPLVGLGALYLYRWRHAVATGYDIAARRFKVDDAQSNVFNVWELDAVKDGDADKEEETRFWHPSQVEIATRFLISNSSKVALEVADKMYLQGIKKFPRSADLMVSYAIFYLVHRQDPSMAENYLKKARLAKPIIDTEFTIYQQEQEIKLSASRVGNKKLDAVDRVEFKQLMKSALMNHKAAKVSIATFWETILSATESSPVETGLLINQVSHMEHSDRNAVLMYGKLLERFPLSVKVLQNYATFLDEIHNNRDEADRVRNKIRKIVEAGLSDDLNVTLKYTHGNNNAAAAAGTGHENNSTIAVRTKTEKRAYKDYRKQVYLYSRHNSRKLRLTVRATILSLLVVAVAQLLIITIGANTLNISMSNLQSADDMRGMFAAVHSSLREAQTMGGTDNAVAFGSLVEDLRGTVDGLRTNGSSLFESTSWRSQCYDVWASVDVDLSVYNGIGMNRTMRWLTLRDAGLQYSMRLQVAVDRLSAAFNSGGATVQSLDTTDTNFRFVLDNGVAIIADEYSNLIWSLNTIILHDYWLTYILSWTVWVISLLLLFLIGLRVFQPIVDRARKDRETSIRAFLQIPKGATLALYNKYHDASSTTANGVGADDAQQFQGDRAQTSRSIDNITSKENEDDGDAAETDGPYDSGNSRPRKRKTTIVEARRSIYESFKQRTPTSRSLNAREQTVYSKLSMMYLKALIVIAVAFSVALTANHVIARSFATAPGTLVLGMELVFRTSRVAVVLDEGINHASVVFDAMGGGSGASGGDRLSLRRIVVEDVDAISRAQVSILYGNASVGIPMQPIADGDSWDILGRTAADISSTFTGLYDTVTRFSDDVTAMSSLLGNTSTAATTAAKTDVATLMERIRTAVPQIVNGYTGFVDVVQTRTDKNLNDMRVVSGGMFGLVALTIFATYFLYWRRIMDYIIKTENERTLKLLLMIPVEIVSDIDSLRELLHLKRSKEPAAASGAAAAAAAAAVYNITANINSGSFNNSNTKDGNTNNNNINNKDSNIGSNLVIDLINSRSLSGAFGQGFGFAQQLQPQGLYPQQRTRRTPGSNNNSRPQSLIFQSEAQQQGSVLGQRRSIGSRPISLQVDQMLSIRDLSTLRQIGAAATATAAANISGNNSAIIATRNMDQSPTLSTGSGGGNNNSPSDWDHSTYHFPAVGHHDRILLELAGPISSSSTTTAASAAVQNKTAAAGGGHSETVPSVVIDHNFHQQHHHPQQQQQQQPSPIPHHRPSVKRRASFSALPSTAETDTHTNTPPSSSKDFPYRTLATAGSRMASVIEIGPSHTHHEEFDETSTSTNNVGGGGGGGGVTRTPTSVLKAPRRASIVGIHYDAHHTTQTEPTNSNYNGSNNNNNNNSFLIGRRTSLSFAAAAGSANIGQQQQQQQYPSSLNVMTSGGGRARSRSLVRNDTSTTSRSADDAPTTVTTNVTGVDDDAMSSSMGGGNGTNDGNNDEDYLPPLMITARRGSKDGGDSAGSYSSRRSSIGSIGKR